MPRQQRFTGPWAICGTCSGDGKHSQRLGVINTEEWDPDELQDYFDGKYDATCEECGGSGKVREPANDEEREEAKAASQFDAEERYLRRIEAYACGERD